jgi:hypothetical protein
MRILTLKRTALVISQILVLLLSMTTDVWSEEPKQSITTADNRFALLVGINDYAQPRDPDYHITPLKGPGNDVALIKKLLVTQYAFKDDGTHIVTLIGAKATHQAIIDGIRELLIKNAKQIPGSTVVFYFSGHGSQAYDTEGITGTGFHQTLVAYDSRREGGTDILDDEINAQLEQLRQFTDKITLIFDSCHSGSVWKDVTTMTSKALPANPFSKPRSRSKSVVPKDVGTTIKPNGGDYSVIVAATWDETAVEDEVQTSDGERFHGLLTFFLDKALRSAGNLTYDQAAKKVAAMIAAHAPSQHPQAEGNIARIFLGSSTDREQSYISVLDVVDTATFRINAGLADGLQPGAILAVYARDSKVLSGETGKIGNARVLDVADFASLATFSRTPTKAITTDAKVIVVTPFAPDKGMPVYLPIFKPGSDQRSRYAAEFIARLRKRLEGSALLLFVNSPRKARVVVRWQCENIAEAGAEFDSKLLQPAYFDCVSGYRFELVPPDQHYILFDLTVAADRDPETLAQAIEGRARQENLRSLANGASSIKSASPGIGPLSMELERLDVSQTGTVPVVISKGVARESITTIKVGDYFRFKITNNSDQSLYIAIFWIGSGGGIGLYSPTNTGELILPGKTLTTRPPLRAGPPQGIETYKVIATTKSGINFRILEQPSVTKAATASHLEWLLNQTGNTTTKDPGVAVDLDVSDWTTAYYDIFVRQ